MPVSGSRTGSRLAARALRACATALAVSAVAACATLGIGQGGGGNHLTEAERFALLKRSQLWSKTDVARMDIQKGPDVPGAFAVGQTVTCDYVKRKLTGRSPKFACAISPDDEVKVKYGADNGEVYGEVAATRLLWALGFGADAMYPVRVVCRGCPADLGGQPGANGSRVFAVAAIERKMPGRDLKMRDSEGWSWSELEFVDPSKGGASVAERDALKLLAAVLQHGDSKPQQQRLVCLDKPVKTDPADKNGQAKPARPELCERPFMLVSDLGVTFGQSNLFNRQEKGSVNLERWAKIPVWKSPDECVANLSKSFTGTLGNPVIAEEGRAFLASLVGQLTDAQLRDLFGVARVVNRTRAPDTENSPRATVDDWVNAFKQKRAAIANQRCAAAQ